MLLCYYPFNMLHTFLVPEKTIVSAKGDGSAIELKVATGRVFLLALAITNVVEQESIEVSIYGSADGVAWDTKPLLMFSQQFYLAEVPRLLDLTAQPDVKLIRAHWEVARWGRHGEPAMFEFHISLREVPAEILAEAVGRRPV